VTDTASGHIISWAKAEYKAYSEEELASSPDCGHEGEDQMNRDWFALNEKLRRDYMGTQRHCCEWRDEHDKALDVLLTTFPDIGMVATHPSYQNHGAATMLLGAMLGEVDKMGVECYLEATNTARPLYEKHGFVAVNEIRFDPTDYGMDGFKIETQTIMVREALDSRGERQAVRPWPIQTPVGTPPAED
jgi:GNAT superfamily N-acetyltransferase